MDGAKPARRRGPGCTRHSRAGGRGRGAVKWRVKRGSEGKRGNRRFFNNVKGHWMRSVPVPQAVQTRQIRITARQLRQRGYCVRHLVDCCCNQGQTLYSRHHTCGHSGQSVRRMWCQRPKVTRSSDHKLPKATTPNNNHREKAPLRAACKTATRKARDNTQQIPGIKQPRGLLSTRPRIVGKNYEI